MDRNEILRAFLSAGYQISADAIAHFEQNPDRVKEFMELAAGKLEKPFVTMEAVGAVMGGISPKLRVLTSFHSGRKETTVSQISDRLNARYQKISEILSKKIELANLISVNRISQQNNKFSIVAMLKEVNPGDRSLLAEDPTGTTTVYISDEAVGDLPYLVEDEIVGLVCDNEDSSENRVARIVFPDIPLPTRVAATQQDFLCMFVSDVHMGEEGFQPRALEKLEEYLRKVKQDVLVFVLGDVSKDPADLERFQRMFPPNYTVMYLQGELEGVCKDNCLPDPVLVEVGGVKIFMSHGKMFQGYMEKFKVSPEGMLLQMIKKRHLSPTFGENPRLDDEKLLLEQVPDIFVIGHYHEPRTANYKGATVISLGSFVTQPIFWSVNLRTRETIKIDLT